MRRRDFIAGLSGAAFGSLVTRAQTALPTVGYLSLGTPDTSGHLVAAVKRGLAEAGYVENQTVNFQFRWAHNDANQLHELAADLVRLHVAVIVTPAATPAVLAAKRATSAIPIVFSTGADPVQIGMVSSLNRPGGNVTGIGGMTAEVGAKRLGLLRELLPGSRRFGLLANSSNPLSKALTMETQAAAQVASLQIEVANAAIASEIEIAFDNFRQRQIQAVVVAPDTLFINRRTEIAALTLRYILPAVFPFREDVIAGGLMSYGPSITDNARMAGVYAGRVLRGESPANLPVVQPTKFELVINLKSAKMLSVAIPPTLLAGADEVIE